MANYQFPTGIGSNAVYTQPYMLLTSYESKNAIESQTKILSSIALYIPPNALKTAFTATWSEQEGAATKAAMGGAIGRLDWTNLGSTTVAAMKGAGLSIAAKAGKTAESQTGMLAAQGLAINNHMALTYKGPTTMRQHEFAFKFFPKNNPEAEAIKDILTDLENGMLPRMGGAAGLSGEDLQKIKGRTLSQPLFNAPRHWTIDFFMKGGGSQGQQETHGNKYLFKIRKSVITAMSINHDPNSTISFHEDGAPVETDLSLTFKEIELPISKGG